MREVIRFFKSKAANRDATRAALGDQLAAAFSEFAQVWKMFVPTLLALDFSLSQPAKWLNHAGCHAQVEISDSNGAIDKLN